MGVRESPRLVCILLSGGICGTQNRKADFHLYSADEYIDLAIDYVEHLRPDMVLERFVSQSPKELLIAPDWGLKNHEFTDKVKKRMRERDAWQGKKYKNKEEQ